MSSVCRVAATSCARNTRAPSQALTAVAASVPVSRSSTGGVDQVRRYPVREVDGLLVVDA